MSATAATVLDQRPEPPGYSQLLNSVVQVGTKLKDGPYRVYLVLASENFGRNYPLVTISQNELADKCGTTVRTIRRRTRQLEQAGWIRTHDRQGCCHRYELLVPHHPGQLLRAVEPNPGQVGQPPLQVPRTQSTKDPGHEEPPRNNQKNVSPFPKEERPIATTQSQLWELAAARLSQELTKANFQTWIAPLRVVAGASDCLTLVTPSRDVLDWVDKRLRGTLERAVIAAAGRRVTVRLV